MPRVLKNWLEIVDRANDDYYKKYDRSRRGLTRELLSCQSKDATDVKWRRGGWYVFLSNSQGIVWVYKYSPKTDRLRSVPRESWPKEKDRRI